MAWEALVQVADPLLSISNGGAVLVSALDIYIGIQYSRKLFRKQTEPRLATWIIFEVGVIMSLVAYFTSSKHSVANAALNITDAVVVTGVLCTLLIHRPGTRTTFTRSEWVCVVISCMTFIAWLLTRNAWVGLGGFQLVMTIAYVPTLESMCRWKPGPSPEPVDTWSINAVAAFIGLCVALFNSHRDYLAALYPLRAFLLCVLVAAMVVRWKGKSFMSESQ